MKGLEWVFSPPRLCLSSASFFSCPAGLSSSWQLRVGSVFPNTPWYSKYYFTHFFKKKNQPKKNPTTKKTQKTKEKKEEKVLK